MTQEIVLVLARADNGVIGKDGGIPWRIPADMRHFKQLTMGTPMIMGRKTFESLGKPLPGRRHIVLTRDAGWQRQGTETVATVEQALAAAGPGRVSVIGGAEIYLLLLGHATAIELTEVRARPDGDTVLPPFDPSAWREASREDHAAEGEAPAYSFVRLERA